MNNNNTVLIKICGKNLDNFLQNIITNDIKKLDDERLLYTSILTPQGKFLHDFFLKKEKESFLIEVNKNEEYNLISVLKGYDIRDIYTFSIVAKKVKTMIYDDAITILNREFAITGYEKNDAFQAFLDPRAKNLFIRFWFNEKIGAESLFKFRSIDEESIELHRIKMCVPNSQKDLEKNKSFLLNYKLDEFNAVSFEKGCYIGQENTAKQKYRGKLKYKLKVVKLLRGEFPKINENLIFSEKKIGVMKSSAKNLGLALIREDFQNLKKELDILGKDCSILII